MVLFTTVTSLDLFARCDDNAMISSRSAGLYNKQSHRQARQACVRAATTSMWKLHNRRLSACTDGCATIVFVICLCALTPLKMALRRADRGTAGESILMNTQSAFSGRVNTATIKSGGYQNFVALSGYCSAAKWPEFGKLSFETKMQTRPPINLFAGNLTKTLFLLYLSLSAAEGKNETQRRNV